MVFLRTALVFFSLNAPLAWAGDTAGAAQGPIRLPPAEAKAFRKALADARLLSHDEDAKGAVIQCLRRNEPPSRFYSASISFPKEDPRGAENARSFQALCKLVEKRFGDLALGAAGSTGIETPPLRIQGKGAEAVVEYAPYEPDNY
ncbi:MAG: hypothetical protein RL653_872 [Pseudomonadota bacterium]|jgi:hypothetical protein